MLLIVANKAKAPAFAFFAKMSPYFGSFRLQFVAAVAALFAVHLVEAAIPLYLQAGIDSIARQEANILAPVLAILGLTALRFLLLNFGRRRNAVVSIGVTNALRQALYEHLLTLGRGFHARYRLGDLMARATNDIAATQRFFRFAVHQLVSLASVTLIAPVFMAQQSLELSLLLVPLLAAMGIGGWYQAERIRAVSEHVQAAYGALTETVQQNLKGIRTIQSHGQEAREIRHFAGTADGYAAASQQLVRWNAMLNGSMVLGSGLMTLAVVGVGGSRVLAGQMSIGTLTAFMLYLTMILGVIRNCSPPVYAYLNAVTAAARVFRIMDEKPEIPDAPDGPPGPPIKGRIVVRDVSFRYPADGDMPATPALERISLSARPGELVAVIGPIGSGKSTLLRLLARQLEPTDGRIVLDGRDLRSIPLGDLRRNLSFVTQDSFLFAASMAENISFDAPERPPEPIWESARAARLEDTIRGFSEGLSTRVGERGVTLSGGQKQRTGLARNLIRDTPILLLDDCFSALDAETGALILSELRARRQSQTTVLVSHRVSTVRHADRIYVLDAGRIVESGSHHELVARGGYYAGLIRMQDEPAEAEPAV